MYRVLAALHIAASQRTSHATFIIAIAALLTISAVAQKGKGGSGGSSTPTRPGPNTPSINNPRDTPTTPSSIVLTGRVVLEPNMPLPENAVVEEVCANTVRGRTRTNRQGDFSLALGQASNAELMTNTDASDNGRSFQDKRLRLAGCELRAVLPGYISTMMPLSGSDAEIGMKNVGTLVLKKIGGAPNVASSIVSATSFQVPDDARKEFDKAQKDAEKKKLKQAEEHLQKAVDIYPKYAAAWVGLGLLHQEAGKMEESKQAFQRAMDADPNFIPPYLHLALYAARERRWEDARALTEKALRLNPVDFADAYFINAIASFNLHHVPEAQKAALKAADIDREHRQPRIQYLLAAIYEATGDREQAAAHLREYLKEAPEAPDASAVKAHLSELSNTTSAEKE